MRFIILFSIIISTIMGCAAQSGFYKCKDDCKTVEGKEVCINVCNRTDKIILSGTQGKESGIEREYKEGVLVKEKMYIKKDSSPAKIPDFVDSRMKD